MKKWMTKTDAILIAVLLLLSASAFAIQQGVSRDQAKTAVVTIEGEVVLELPLETVKTSETIPLPNGIILEAQAKKIRVKSANCKDKICVKTGWLEQVGDVAACLPNQTVVSIRATEPGDLDALTY